MAEGLWLRLWVAAVRSRKIQTLSDNLFRWWVNLLCLSKAADGVLPPFADIAWELRTTEERVSKAVDSLKNKRLIDDFEGHFRMHDWNDWQFNSDVSTERTRRFKERQRNGTGTFPQRSANGEGTPRARAQRQSTETEYRDREFRVDDACAEFIRAYPEKGRKKPGLIEHWYAANVGTCLDPAKLHAEILAGLERAKRSDEWARAEGKYICGMLPFLEGKRWLEEWPEAEKPDASRPKFNKNDID